MGFEYWGDGSPLILPDVVSTELDYWADGSPIDIIYAPDQVIYPSSIASAEAFGTLEIPSSGLEVAPTGIASAEAFGAPQLNQVIYPTGIASGEQLGTPDIPWAIFPAGIASDEVLGSPQVNQIIYPAEVAPAEVFGSPQLNQNISPAGVASAAAFGTAEVQLRLQFIQPTQVTNGPVNGIWYPNLPWWSLINASLPNYPICRGSVTLVVSGRTYTETGELDDQGRGILGTSPYLAYLNYATGALVVSYWGMTEPFATATYRWGLTILPQQAFGVPEVNLTAYEPPGEPEDETIPGGRNWRVVIPSVLANGNEVKITILGGADASILAGCSIGERGVGDDFLGTPIRVTFNGGGNGTTIPARTEVTSDWIEFTVDMTKQYLVHLYYSGTHKLVTWKNSRTYLDSRLDPENETMFQSVAYDPISNKSYSVKRILVAESVQFVRPVGIESWEIFGEPQVGRNVLPTGIASGEGVGTPQINQTVNPVGIATGEAVGTPLLQQSGAPQMILPYGIESAGGVGGPRLIYRQDIAPDGIATEEGVGAPVLSATVTVRPSGIGSAEAVEGPVLTTVARIYPQGLQSAGGFGLTMFSVGQALIVIEGGVGSQEGFGSPRINQVIYPDSIFSDEAFGNFRIQYEQFLRLIGIPSQTAVGAPAVVPGAVSLYPGGIPSEEAVSSRRLHVVRDPIPAFDFMVLIVEDSLEITTMPDLAHLVLYAEEIEEIVVNA